jgi:hypothetical protein
MNSVYFLHHFIDRKFLAVDRRSHQGAHYAQRNSNFTGLILILFSAIKLLPFFGITVSVAGFSLDAWFPVVFMIIGLCELIINPSVNWLIGIAMIVLGGIDLVKNIGV